jgi:hypothetical protein
MVNNLFATVYEETAAEIIGGSTIVNYGYKPGFVDRYGNNTVPGTTDMTQAIVRATNSGSPVKFKSGVTYYHTPLEFEGLNIDWSTYDGEEQATLYCDTSPATSQAQFLGTTVLTTTTTADAFPNEMQLALTSATGVQNGDLLVVQNDTLWPSDPRGLAFEGQLAKITAISGLTVTLDAALTCGMPAGTTTVTVYRPISIKMKGVNFERLRINGSSRGWLVFAADNPYIENCGALNSTRIGLHVHRCYKGTVFRGTYAGANLAISGQLGYGILVEGCWGTAIRETLGRECRRGIDLSGYTGVPSWYCIIAGNRYFGGGNAEDGSPFFPLGAQGGSAYGSHGPCAGTVYESNVIFNAYRGFTIRGRDETVRNNLIVGASFTPVWQQYGGGLVVEHNRYSSTFEEGISAPFTTVDSVSYEKMPDSFMHVAGGMDENKYLTINDNIARNVKSTLIFLEGLAEIYNYTIRDNLVCILDEAAPVGSTVGVIRGSSISDAFGFIAQNNIVLTQTDYSINKYRLDFVDTVSQVGINTYRITLVDDSAARVRLGKQDTQISVKLFRDSANTTPRFNGILRFESTTTVDWGGSSGVTVSNVALDGTTGVDGATTISWFGDSVYLENRSGAITVYVMVLEGLF